MSMLEPWEMLNCWQRECKGSCDRMSFEWWKKVIFFTVKCVTFLWELCQLLLPQVFWYKHRMAKKNELLLFWTWVNYYYQKMITWFLLLYASDSSKIMIIIPFQFLMTSIFALSLATDENIVSVEFIIWKSAFSQQKAHCWWIINYIPT